MMIIANLLRLPCGAASQRAIIKTAIASKQRLGGSCVGPARLFTMAAKYRVAVLYQATDPPMVNGTRKPKKPGGITSLHLLNLNKLTLPASLPWTIANVALPYFTPGYQDSGADIAYNLRGYNNVEVLTPAEKPDATKDAGWCFPDTEEGIMSALDRGATHLWANTVLFAQHPLQVSERISRFQEHVRVVGQSPLMVDKYDDKKYVNNLLRKQGLGLTLPRSWGVSSNSSSISAADKLAAPDLESALNCLLDDGLPFPVVAKPIRGRGSYGVKVCRDAADLLSHATDLTSQGLHFMIEEYLAGEEATVTVMPPPPESLTSGEASGEAGGGGAGRHWELPIVTRFHHQDGVAPYSGEVAVTTNSRALTTEELLLLSGEDLAYAKIVRECEAAADVLGTTAPIRVDVRRFAAGRDFAMFDVNMKPVSFTRFRRI